jgi:hypothetical protein
MKRPGVLFIASLPLGGCSGAPSIWVFGAFFPDWLFCIAAGVVGTLIVHRVASKRHQVGVLNPLALSYPMLTTLLAVLTRLLFFPR